MSKTCLALAAALIALFAAHAAAQQAGPPFPLTRPDMVRALTAVMSAEAQGSEANPIQPELVAAAVVAFDPETSEVLPESYPLLDTFAQVFAQDFPADMFAVVGHVGRGMRPEDAMDLSLLRAEAVKAYLVEKHGLDPNLFLVQGYGDFMHLPAPEGMDQDTMNNRIEFIRL